MICVIRISNYLTSEADFISLVNSENHFRIPDVWISLLCLMARGDYNS